MGFDAVKKVQQLRRSMDAVIRQRDEAFENHILRGGGDLSGEIGFRPRRLGECLAELARRRAETDPMTAKAIAQGITHPAPFF